MLRKSIVMLIGVILLASTSGFAWEDSFRHKISGSLLYGDFDNDLDPVYVWDNEGYRVYTTFSNLTTSEDRFFGNSSDDIYLFGTSGKFGLPSIGDWESRTMLLLQLDDSRYDQYCYLPNFDFWSGGPTEDNGYGSLSGHRVQYENWNDSLQTWEDRYEYDASADNYYSYKRKDWHITHSYKNDGSIFGLSFTHMANGYGSYESNYIYGSYNNGYYGFNWMYPAYTFTHSYSQAYYEEEVGGTPKYYEYGYSGDYNTKRNTPINVLKLSYERPCGILPDSRMRLDLAYMHTKFEVDVNDMLENYYWRDTAYAGAFDVDTMREIYTHYDIEKGGLFMPGAQLTKNWNADVYSWFRLDVGFGSYDIEDTDGNNYHEYHQYDAAFQNSTTTMNSGYAGDISRLLLGLYHKTVVEFGEKLTFAGGLSFTYTKEKGDGLDYSYETNLTSIADDGDGAPSLGDNERYYHYSESGSADYNYTETIITLPLAFEYKLKRWTFRLGAVHSINNWEEEVTYDHQGPVEYYDSTFYNDGVTTPIGTDQPFNIYEERSSELEKHKSQDTDFFYGLEFAATKNLNIELIYFLSNSDDYFQADIFDLDFYQSLRMSFTLKF